MWYPFTAMSPSVKWYWDSRCFTLNTTYKCLVFPDIHISAVLWERLCTDQQVCVQIQKKYEEYFSTIQIGITSTLCVCVCVCVHVCIGSDEKNIEWSVGYMYFTSAFVSATLTSQSQVYCTCTSHTCMCTLFFIIFRLLTFLQIIIQVEGGRQGEGEWGKL